MALGEEERRRQLMGVFENAIADSAPAQEDTPQVTFDIDDLRRRVKSRSPEEVASIVAEIDELLLGAEIDEILQNGC